jgi:hypothetical protein
MTPSISQDAVNVALGNFLTKILPAGVSIVIGQVNRVAEPLGDLVVMWPLRLPRLSTNIDSSDDTKFEGAIAGGVMTVTAMEIGTVAPGRTVFGVGVVAATTIVNQIAGTPGGVGTYTVAPGQNVPDTTLSAGGTAIEQSTECVMQFDVHGPNSFNNAQVISTLFRDGYAVDQMDGTGITPLYASDPRQLPFINGAAQYEDRWVIEAHMQIKPVVAVPQEYADAVSVTLVNVDAPPYPTP